MADHIAAAERDASTRVPERHIESFTKHLAELGYTSVVVRDKRAVVEGLARWIVRRRIDVAKIDEGVVGAFLLQLRPRQVPVGNRRCTSMAFLEHLRATGVAIRPEPKRNESQEALLLQRYETYLLEERGLDAETVRNYLRFATAFLHDRFTGSRNKGSISGLGFQDVRDYLLSRTRMLKLTTSQLAATALRSFLRFLFLRGETAVDLAAAVPSARRWRKATTHPYLRPEEVERLLAACDRATAAGRRDHAMLLLLARLGLRACEVATMEMQDLRWRAGEIVVRGKGQIHQRLPMLPDVGAAVALYLRDARPKSPCRNVFLRNDAPRVALGADAVGLMVGRALARAGLNPSRHGSHLLRSSLATNMIRRGATLAEIGEVLRHRSPETTEIYAKVDFEALRGVALPWSGPGGVS